MTDRNKIHPTGRLPRNMDGSLVLDDVPREFTLESISTAAGSPITFRFTSDVCRAECAGATLYAEADRDESAQVTLKYPDGKILALITVHRNPDDDSLTTSLRDVGSALLWSWERKVRGA